MHRGWLLATARRRPYSPRPPPTENPPCALFITSPCCSPPSAARLHRHPTPPLRPNRRSTPPTQIGLGSPPPATPIQFASAASNRKSTRLNSSHTVISYAVFCLKKKKNTREHVMRHAS